MIDKILLVVCPDYPSEHGDFNGGNTVKNQITYSRRMFKKVIVITPVLRTGGLTPQDKHCFNYIYDNVYVYYPRCLFFPRSVKVPGVSNYAKVNIDTRLSATLDTIAENNLFFDIIHAHFTYPSAYIASELKKQYHVPVIATIHEDSGWFAEERKMDHPKFRQAWESADIVTRVNTTELPLLRTYNPDVRCVPGGYNPDTYRELGRASCRKYLNLSPTEKILFTFGFLDERKGFQDLIAAIAHLPATYHAVKCYISGSGYYKRELEEMIQRMALENRVFIIDHMKDNKIALWINACDLFIFPSLRESFGSTQIEALGCGAPVVASDNVGSIDVIKPDCGYLYPTGDSLGLCTKIIKGLTTKWDKFKILDYAQKTYAWNVVSKQYDAMYMELLKR